MTQIDRNFGSTGILSGNEQADKVRFWEADIGVIKSISYSEPKL
jgi:hypothetical protein